MVKNFDFNAARSENQKKYVYKLKDGPKTRILDSWLKSADRKRIFESMVHLHTQ